MADPQPKKQWEMCVRIYHSPQFGHSLWIVTATTGRAPNGYSLGTWKGLGIPGPVLEGATAKVFAVFQEHLVTRYGVAEELSLKWAGEPGPH